MRRYVFVTIGATAGFQPLIDEVASPAFLARLRALGYTDLVVQCGPSLDLFHDRARAAALPAGQLRLRGFDFTDDIQAEMRLAVPDPDPKAGGSGSGSGEGPRGHGAIITHGGSGSILDALPLQTRLIIVPNPSLMNNHQDQLALKMEKDGHAIWGKLGHLAEAMDQAENFAPRPWPLPIEAAAAAAGGGGQPRAPRNLADVCEDLVSQQRRRAAPRPRPSPAPSLGGGGGALRWASRAAAYGFSCYAVYFVLEGTGWSLPGLGSASAPAAAAAVAS